MFKLICVTNRTLCKGDFKEQVEKIAKAGISAIILREKDLSEEQYKELAKEVISICEASHVPCILHNFPKTAQKLEQDRIHLSLTRLREHPELSKQFKTIGVSVHSVEEGVEAQHLGASYLVAGHVFLTDCKKDLPPRGTTFLQNVVEAVSIPVFAIGGIHPDNIAQTKVAGAKGACIMSSLMKETCPTQYLQYLHCNLDKNGKKGR